MRKKSTIFLLITAALIGLVVIFYWREYAQQQGFDWRESWVPSAYSETSDQPYGTQVLHRLLGGYFPEKKRTDIKGPLVRHLPLDSARASTYVLVGEGLFLDSTDLAHLLAFVQAGHTAFVSSKTIPYELMEHLQALEGCGEQAWEDYASMDTEKSVQARLIAPWFGSPVSLHYARKNQPREYAWSYLEPAFFCPEQPQRALGYLNDTLVNFAAFPYGKGRFLLHSTPIAFSNYHLLRPDARRYAEGVLAHLPPGNLYWDAEHRVSEMVARRRNFGGNRQFPSEHPLAYVLQQPPLAWAWYLLVGLAGVYLLFRAKRRQRIIPILGKKENSSYEFIGTIANLHFREKNYRYLCVQTMRLFLAQVRERYNLTAQLDHDTLRPRYDAHFEQRLEQISGVPLPTVRDIFARYTATVQYEPTEEMMVQLHLAVEDFWKNAR